jgi:hypothetical protein
LRIRLSQRCQFALLCWPPVLYRQHAVQGSRKPRSRDYRCDLLLASASRYGLASKSGLALGRDVFRRQVAKYKFEFGYHHLTFGEKGVAKAALWQAWLMDKRQIRRLMLSVLATFGWRPLMRRPSSTPNRMVGPPNG